MTTPAPDPARTDPATGTGTDLDLWGAWAFLYTVVAGHIGIRPETRATHTAHAALALHGLPRNEEESWVVLDWLFSQSTRIGWPDTLCPEHVGATLEQIYATGTGIGNGPL